MRKLFILSIFLLLGVIPFMGISIEEDKRVIYISSSTGNDTNPGTMEQPLKSISQVKGRNNVCIRLKCGDVFYENIHGFENSIIESYGEGNKPIICGFRILKNPEAWTFTEEGFWKLDLQKEENFTGFPLSLSSDKKRFVNFGCMYDTKRDRIYGHIVRSKEELKKSGDLFLTEKFKTQDIDGETFHYLYAKFSFSPQALGNLCFSVFEHGVSDMDKCIIRNIAVVGFGKHGMCGLNHTQVEHCDLDIIGGSIQTGTPKWVRFGNGIEFWITRNPIGDSTVKNCLISRTYDCGSTIQGSPKDLGSPENIHFVNNTYRYCRQAFEHFLNSTNTEPRYIDCEFSDNLCFRMGENGFSSPEARDAAILSYEGKERALKIENNVIYGSNYYCGFSIPLGMDKNRVYIYKGSYLNHYHGIKNYPTIDATDNASVKQYRSKFGDNSKIVILDEGSSKDLRIRKSLLRKIHYQKPDLKIDRLLH